MMETILKRAIRDQKGAALTMVLILLVLGGLILAPLLGLMSAGLMAGQVYENSMHALYAADAGVDDGLWQIRNVELADRFPDYDEYDYSTAWEYDLYDHQGGVAEVVPLNAKNVSVAIENVWIPKDIPAPDAAAAEQIIEAGELIITGNPSGPSQYQIRVSYSPCGGAANTQVETLGIWLPAGFEYDDNCSLEGEVYYSEPDVTPYKGGYAVVWNFVSPILIKDLPDTVTFRYSGPQAQTPAAALSWIVAGGDYYAWDADVRVYKVTSTATDPETGKQTTVESYTSKIEPRKLASALSGDYYATGNSLVGYSSTDKYRDRLYRDNEATIETDEYGISGIPSDATIEAALLYWTGWIDFHYRYRSWYSWRWGEVDALMYPDNPTPENLATLVEQEAKVNKVSLSIGDNVRDVTAATWQVVPLTDASRIGTWSYCCLADVTTLIKEDIEAEDIPSNGAGTYTLSHSSAVINQHRPETSYYYYDFYDTSGGTGYPLGSPALGTPASSESDLRDQSAYAGWSLVVIYSSPRSKGHQLYLYDIQNPGFLFTSTWIYESGTANPDFDGDGSPGGHISGFLVPEPIPGEDIAAKLTVFVGEGDSFIDEDQLKVNGYPMSNAESPSDNVWNSRSPGLAVPGVDIDTFYVDWDDGIVNPGDTSAQVDMPALSHGSGSDGFNLVHIILSFRSQVTSGGVMGYLIRG